MSAPLWLRRLGCAILWHRVTAVDPRECIRCERVLVRVPDCDGVPDYAYAPAPPRNQPLATPADIRRMWEVEQARERVRLNRISGRSNV